MATVPILLVMLCALATVAPSTAAPRGFMNYDFDETAPELNNGTNYTLGGFGGPKTFRSLEFSKDYVFHHVQDFPEDPDFGVFPEDPGFGDFPEDPDFGDFNPIDLNNRSRLVFAPKLEGECMKVEPAEEFSTSKVRCFLS